MNESKNQYLDENNELDEYIKRELEMDGFLCEEIQEFKKQSIRTKESLLQSIDETRKKFESERISNKGEHAEAFYKSLDKLLEHLTVELYATILPEPLNDWWYYSYEITSTGIKLMLNCLSWSCDYDNGNYDCSRQQKFVLVNIPAALLTVSEYAQKYGVGPGTVRQWIRRAKIRSAVKAGREWRIPELAELRKERDYLPCRYTWSAALADIPEKYTFLKDFDVADFIQDSEDKTRFYIYPYSSEDARYGTFFANPELDCSFANPELYDKTLEVLSRYPGLNLTKEGAVCLTGKEREELELYMIGNPLVQFSPHLWWFNDQIAEIGSDYCPNSFTLSWS